MSSAPQCSATNKTTGSRCKSRVLATFEMCRRHMKEPTDAECAAAAAALGLVAQFHDESTFASRHTIISLSATELNDLFSATSALYVNQPDYDAHKTLRAICDLYGIKNDFTVLFDKVQAYNSRCLDYQAAIYERLAYKERWDAIMTPPIADDLEELEDQRNLAVALYNEVMEADNGCGLQMWQILASAEIGRRLDAIKARLAL